MELPKRLKNGLRLGAWTLGRAINSGGQGAVWEVRPTVTTHSPPRAMKVCVAENPQARARFAQEVDILRVLEHPGVVPILDAEVEWRTDPNTGLEYSFYVTERFESSVADLLWLHEAPLYALRLFCQLCDAIVYIHGRDPVIIHRDLKPANVLLGSEPRRVAVADFGIARPDDEDRVRLTHTHEVVGTMYYRAPEVLMGHAATVRSDVYSLGRTLEWMLTGLEPNETMPRRIQQLAELTERACRSVDEVIARACQMDPRLRFGSVSELKEALPDLRAATPQELASKARSVVASAAGPERQGTPTEAELRELLNEHHGNVAAVGRLFGKERMQVHRWMERYGIDPGEYR